MRMRNIIIAALAATVIVVGIYLYTNTGVVKALAGLGQSGTPTQTTSAKAASSGTTVQIQPAAAIVKAVSASGNVALVSQSDVAAQVGGTVAKVNVQAGDVITAGQVLLSLATTDLERAVAQEQLAVDTQQNQIAILKEPAKPEDLATAQANLASAQASLAKLQAGPTAPALAAAQSALAAAQAKYNDLVTPPSQDQLTQLSAAMDKAQVAVAQAQTAYDQVKTRPNAGMSAEGAALEQATIAYESAKVAYDQATQPPAQGNVQAALSAVQSAKQTLDALAPTDADIASAQAQVTSAQAQLDTLLAGSDSFTLNGAGYTLQQDLLSLQQAEANLAAAQVRSPIAGTVLAVDAIAGQQLSAGSVVASVADPSQLQLTVNVAEVDIAQLQPGQAAQVTIDAFPGQSFQGKVNKIVPVSSSTSGVINYPVTVLLTDNKLGSVRPGMTAVATMTDAGAPSVDAWFVPTNAINQQNGSATVNVMRNGAAVPIQVTPGQVKGDWTLVKSSQLQATDQVVGSVTTKLTTNQPAFGAPGAPGGRPGGFTGGGRQNRAAP